MQSTFGGTKSAGFEGPIPPPQKNLNVKTNFLMEIGGQQGCLLCSSLLSFFASHSILSLALPLQILYSPVFSSERRAKFVSKYKKEEKKFFFDLDEKYHEVKEKCEGELSASSKTKILVP